MRVTTLVICVDRSGDIARATSVPMPVTGWEAVRSLVTEVGLTDPEDSSVNTLLEALRVARELRDEDETATVAVVSGTGSTAMGGDRSIAAQLDGLVKQHDSDRAMVVIDSPADERVIPIVESRLRVDSVDRVVVRQSRDIESTYYILKQFLADEKLRSTVLVPVGTALLLLPGLLLRFSAGVALAGLAALLGGALLYMGLGIDEYVDTLPERGREALYAGQLSVVTYVVAGGLTLVGLFFGALGVSELSNSSSAVAGVTQFVYTASPWAAGGALTASCGRLIDELIREDRTRRPYLNLPFLVVAVGLVVRGFAGYFLAQEGAIDLVTISGISISPAQRLATFILMGLLVSLSGVLIAADIRGEPVGEPLNPEEEDTRR